MRVYGYTCESVPPYQTPLKKFQAYRRLELPSVDSYENIFTDAWENRLLKFADREWGRHLLGILKRGDMLVVPSIREGFYHAGDFLERYDAFKQFKWKLRVIDLGPGDQSLAVDYFRLAHVTRLRDFKAPKYWKAVNKWRRPSKKKWIKQWGAFFLRTGWHPIKLAQVLRDAKIYKHGKGTFWTPQEIEDVMINEKARQLQVRSRKAGAPDAEEAEPTSRADGDDQKE